MRYGRKSRSGNDAGTDAGLEASQRQLKNVVQRGERGGQRNRRIELPNLLGRPERDLCRFLIDERGRAGGVLPVEAEAEAMATFLPHKAVGQLVAAPHERSASVDFPA